MPNGSSDVIPGTRIPRNRVLPLVPVAMVPCYQREVLSGPGVFVESRWKDGSVSSFRVYWRPNSSQIPAEMGLWGTMDRTKSNLGSGSGSMLCTSEVFRRRVRLEEELVQCLLIYISKHKSKQPHLVGKVDIFSFWKANFHKTEHTNNLHNLKSH